MDDITLILEGGALRSLYTAGVLDTFMKNNIEAKRVIGVSAGALSGMNYLSKQVGRTAKINIEHCNDSNFIGTNALVKEKGLIGFDYLFEDISKNQDPFNFEAFNDSKQEFFSVVTNCETGKSEYIEKNDAKDIMKVVRASSSLPLCSQTVEIGKNHYLDGGVTNSIPVEWALKQGYKNIVVVLTRDKNYRKKPVSKMMKKVYGRVYKEFPKAADKMCTIPERYNETKELINKLEKEGKILVIRPQKEVQVTRLERDSKKLESLYQEGIQDAEEKLEEIYKLIGRQEEIEYNASSKEFAEDVDLDIGKEIDSDYFGTNLEEETPQDIEEDIANLNDLEEEIIKVANKRTLRLKRN